MVLWEIVISLSYLILYWFFYYLIDVLVDNGWIWIIKKVFIFIYVVRFYLYKINYYNNSLSIIEFIYCVYFGDEYLKNFVFMKFVGNEIIIFVW